MRPITGTSSLRRWLRENEYDDVAELVEEIECQWKSERKATRCNWWEILSGDKYGHSRKIAGRVIPVLQVAQLRQGKPVTANAIRMRPAELRDKPLKYDGGMYMDRLLFVKSRCYSNGGARILEVSGDTIEKAFVDDPSIVEEWVAHTVAAAAPGDGMFIWSGNYRSVEERIAVRRLDDAEWALIRAASPLWAEKKPQESSEGLVFDIFRVSDRIAGRVGADVTVAPIDGAVFNAQECRWEKRIRTVEELARVASETGTDLLLSFPAPEYGDLPVLDIKDADDSER